MDPNIQISTDNGSTGLLNQDLGSIVDDMNYATITGSFIFEITQPNLFKLRYRESQEIALFKSA